MGLLDFLQSTSNAAASNVSGPVDLLAFALRKAGLPIPENSVGSSAWMEQKGLTRKVKQGASQVAGETLGLLSPALAAAKAPQIAQGLLKAQANAAAPQTLNPQKGAIVWHGSPHKFDKFDSSKIGTGEGAQAYGHGLYFADSPEVAKTYAGAGKSIGGHAFENKLSKLMEQAQDAGRYGEAGALEDLLINRNPAMAYSKYRVDNGYSPETVAQAHAVIKQFEKKFVPAGLYKVDLPDEHIAKMLDWDKPLSQQAPEVQKMLAPLGYRHNAQETAAFDDALLSALQEGGPSTLPKMPRNPMGSEIARGTGIFDAPGDVVKAERLRKAGIPGIRYLDGGSRGAGSGTSNYVVFPGNEGLLKILERNGVKL